MTRPIFGVVADKKIAELISEGLRTGIVHPGRDGGKPTPISLPMFRTAGMPPEMGELVDETAKLLGEAIVALIENQGKCEIVDKDEASRLRIAPDADASRRVVAIHCRCDDKRTNPLAVLTVTSSPYVIIDGKSLIEGLTQRSPECPHHRTVT